MNQKTQLEGTIDGEVALLPFTMRSDGSPGVPTTIDPDLTETDKEGFRGVKVFVQDQTTQVQDFFFHNEIASVNLATATAVDDRTVTLEAGQGALATVGNNLEIAEGLQSAQYEILIIAGDILTLDSPIDAVYTMAALVEISTVNMAVDGSVTPVIFELDPIEGQEWDVTRVILVVEASGGGSGMDFTTFGSLAALTNGCVLRFVNGETNNLFNWKTNGDFINRAFDHVFQTNLGATVTGFTSRFTFGGQDKHGVVVRLTGDNNDELQVVVQDDLTGLDSVRMIGQGHDTQI